MSKPLHEIMAQLLSGNKLEEDNVVGKQSTSITIDKEVKDLNQEAIDTANIIKSAPMREDPNKKQDEITDEDVDGIADGILVVTDPEISSEEFEEVADELQGIVDNTEAGELPFTDKYEGDYILSCPICGGTFVNDTLLESGEDTCPICCKIPDAFVVNGKVENNEAAIEKDDIQEDIEHEENLEEPVEEEIEEMPVDEPELEEIADATEDPTKKESKEVEGNKLQESKLEEDEYDDYIENEKALSADYCERVKKSITQEARVAFADLKDILDTETNDTSVDGFYFPSKAVAVLDNTDKRHNLNSYMDLTVSNILNLVDDNDTIEGAVEELFADYKADSALSWADNFVTVLGKLDFDFIDDEELEELDEGKLTEAWVEKDFSDDIDDTLTTLLGNIYQENGIETGDISPEQSEEFDEIISRLNKLFNGLCEGNTPIEESKILEGDLSKDLYGKEADNRNLAKQKEYERDLQYVKDIMAGKTVIDDKYHEELDLDTAKSWLRKDYVYINNLMAASPEEIDKKLAKDLPEIFKDSEELSEGKKLDEEKLDPFKDAENMTTADDGEEERAHYGKDMTKRDKVRSLDQAQRNLDKIGTDHRANAKGAVDQISYEVSPNKDIETYKNAREKEKEFRANGNGLGADIMYQQGNKVADKIRAKGKKEEYIDYGFAGDPFDKHDFEDMTDLEAYIKDHGYELLNDEHIAPDAMKVEVFDPAGNDGEVYVYDIAETEKGVTIEMNHKDSFNMNESKKMEEAPQDDLLTRIANKQADRMSKADGSGNVQTYYSNCLNALKDNPAEALKVCMLDFEGMDERDIPSKDMGYYNDLKELQKQLNESKKIEESKIEYTPINSEEDFGSDAEVIEALYLELGKEVDETWSNVFEDMDNGKLQIATIDGKPHFVYDDGAVQGYSLGRASDNMPIVKTGSIEKDLLKEEIVVSGTDEQIAQAREDSIEKGLCTEEKLVENKVVWSSEGEYTDADNEDFKEWFEMNGYNEYLEEVEDEDEKQAIINDYLETYNEDINESLIEDWNENIIPLIEKQLCTEDLLILQGTAETWNRKGAAGRVLRGVSDLQSLVADYDIINLAVDSENNLEIQLVHHDGTHSMNMYTFNGDYEGVYNKLVDLGESEFIEFEDYEDATSMYYDEDMVEFMMDNGYQEELKAFLVPIKWNV